MALMALIMIGMTLGWLASILARTESARQILSQMGLGLVTALVAGLLVNHGTILGGLSWIALGASVGACILVLAGYHLISARRRSEA